jgi:quinol monooxygenase YgiN
VTTNNGAKGFPKWKYPGDGGAGKVVNTAEEEQALGPGWVDEPVQPATSGEITLIAVLVAQPDKIDETRDFLFSLVGQTRPEAGCVEYNLHQGTDNPAEFTFYETWTSRGAWDLHMTKPYVQEIAHRAKELLAVTPQIRLMRMIGDRA